MGGKLVVFEGIEGSGKTTQLNRLQDWLLKGDLLMRVGSKSHPIPLLVTREPGGTQLGQEIRQLLLKPGGAEPIHASAELLLYAADRAQHVEILLNPNLRQGALILCDRYTDSTIAYQGYGRGLDRTLIDQMNQIATTGLESDLTFWLDLDVEIGLQRTQQRGIRDRMEQASIEFHQRVRQGFANLAIAHPHRIVRIEANRSVEEIASEIQAVLQQRLWEWYGEE